MGRGRIDLLVRWPYDDAQGQRQWQRESLELKVWRDKKPDPRGEGLAQLDAYLERQCLDQGVLVIFDRRRDLCTDAPPMAKRIAFAQAQTPAGRAAVVLRA